MPDEIFVTYPELPDYGIPRYSRKHLLDMMRAGKFPRSVQLSPNRVAWRASELARWCAERPIARSVREPAGAADTAPRFVRRAPSSVEAAE